MKAQLPDMAAFFNADDPSDSYHQALAYARTTGHVATLPDIIDARIAIGTETKRGWRDSPWDSYITTNSAEFVGYSKGGSKLIIVAHGLGPLSTLEGFLKAHRHERSRRVERPKNGGRISAKEFRKLEDGRYGPVSIVEMEPYLARYRYPFLGSLTASEALEDPLVHARLGPSAELYVHKHAGYAREYYLKNEERGPQKVADPVILTMRDASNCSYQYRALEPNEALAHLLGIMQIEIRSDYRSRDVGGAFHCEVYAHECGSAVRFAGIRYTPIRSFVNMPSGKDLWRKHWKDLFVPWNEEVTATAFYTLMQVAPEVWFTQARKVGASLDTGEPEFLVTAIEPIGKPLMLKTTAGSGFYFKYDCAEARALCPEGANAYQVVPGSIGLLEENGEELHVASIQPYQVTVDTSKRIMPEKQLASAHTRIIDLLAA